MIGPEWRKAGRTFDDLQEKIRGDGVSSHYRKEQLTLSWEQLPAMFREHMEAHLKSKMQAAVRAQVEQELKSQIDFAERKNKEYMESEKRYIAAKGEAAKAQADLQNMKQAIKLGQALKTFCESIGVQQHLEWW